MLLVVVREIPPASFGAFSMAAALVAIGSYAAEGGATQATSSRRSLDLLIEQALLARTLLTGVAVYFVQFGVAHLIALRQGLAEVPLYVLILGITTIAAASSGVSIGRLQRGGWFAAIGRAQMFASAVSASIALVTFASTDLTVGVLLIQTVVQASVFAVVMLVHPRTRIFPCFRHSPASSLHVSANYALGSSLISVVARRADDVVVGAVLGPAALGYYSLAYRVLSVGYEFLVHPIERTSLPAIASQGPGSSIGARVAANRQRQAALIVAPLLCALGLAAAFGTSPLLGDEWSPAATVALILCLAGSVQASYFLTYPALFALASPRVGFNYAAGIAALLLTGIAAGLPFGINGVALGYFFAALAGAGLALRYRRKFLPGFEAAGME